MSIAQICKGAWVLFPASHPLFFASATSGYPKAIGEGKLMQYVPENGLYTYFRYHPQQTVMVVSHTGTTELIVTMNRFTQRTTGFTKARNVVTGEVMPLTDFIIQPKQSLVFELLK